MLFIYSEIQTSEEVIQIYLGCNSGGRVILTVVSCFNDAKYKKLSIA